MDNHRVAQRFLEIADALEQASANPFRVKAYRRAAQTIERLKSDIADVARSGSLESIPGIGSDLAAKIMEFIRTGNISDPAPEDERPNQDREKLPPIYRDLIAARIMDERLARLIHRRFRMEEPDDLERLVRSRLLRTLPQFPPEKERSLLDFLAGMAGR